MSGIESTSKPIALPLIQGQPMLLGLSEQLLLASLLCLIAMRNEFGAFPLMVAVPNDDRDWLRTHLCPPWQRWHIWVAKYEGPADEHWAYHLPMHIDSTPTSETGPDKVNTQTTTLVIGQLCAHLLSSTVLGDPGYRGVRPSRIWPPSGYAIDWATVPAYGDAVLLSWAEALSRDIPIE